MLYSISIVYVVQSGFRKRGCFFAVNSATLVYGLCLVLQLNLIHLICAVADTGRHRAAHCFLILYNSFKETFLERTFFLMENYFIAFYMCKLHIQSSLYLQRLSCS